MRYYAIVDSERQSQTARKGGNKWIVVQLFNGNKKVASIGVDTHARKDKEKVHISLLPVTGRATYEVNTISTPESASEEIKGKKQKGEIAKLDDCWCGYTGGMVHTHE